MSNKDDINYDINRELQILVDSLEELSKALKECNK